MIAVDTSVTVAAFAPWHESHRSALEALAQRPRLVGHVAMETYAVLTRLPAPHRAPPGIVADFLARNFPEPPILLPAEEHLRLLSTLARQGIAGGGVYDALVAATATHAQASLVTLDRRALPTYRAVGATVGVLD